MSKPPRIDNKLGKIACLRVALQSTTCRFQSMHDRCHIVPLICLHLKKFLDAYWWSDLINYADGSILVENCVLRLGLVGCIIYSLHAVRSRLIMGWIYATYFQMSIWIVPPPVTTHVLSLLILIKHGSNRNRFHPLKYDKFGNYWTQMWDMQIVTLFTVRVLVLDSRAGKKIQDLLCMKKTPTKERTMLDY